MGKKQLARRLLILLLSAFLWTGCAHRPAATSREVSTYSPGHQNRQIRTSQTERVSPDAETGDAFESDFFNEEFEEEIITIADPLRPWNWLMFQFNDKLYFWLLKPLAQGYRFIVPELVRTGVKNFFNNVAAPVRFTNSLLQGKVDRAGVELGSFMINSTWGVLGLGNLTQKHPELKPSDEDLGQTLGFYGFGDGFYLVWPFLGPSNLRDTVGMVGDGFLSPFGYIDPWEAALGINSLRILNETSFRIGDYEAFKNSAIEPYEALKDAYTQNRKKKVEE